MSSKPVYLRTLQRDPFPSCIITASVWMKHDLAQGRRAIEITVILEPSDLR